MEKKEIVPTTEEVIVKELPTEKKALSNYLRFDIIENFEQFPFIPKLALCQKVPKDKIKSRKIGGKDVKYLSYKYCQKVLNFIFNFKISNKIVSSEYIKYTEEVDNYVWDDTQKKSIKKGKKNVEVIEADIVVEYSFIHPQDSTIISRTVSSAHKSYENKAISRGQVRQAALSKSWTAVAATFGIGQSLEEEEETGYDALIKKSQNEAEEAPRPTKFYDIQY